ncbi:MAG: DNA repair protein RadC [Defluviitaleaceae bacterium]|nr:DNA repair protein RadC [Defluviitaleaceae bacterium]
MSDDKNLHAGHRDRMKEKFIASGFEHFAEHEVLEMLLFYCYSPRLNTNGVAHKMIDEFGSLHNLFEADPLEISKRCKVTKHVAVLVSMVPQLSNIYSMSKWKKGAVRLMTPNQASEYCVSLFAGESNECMYLICLNHQRFIIKAEKISEGTLTQTMVYPRLIVQTALKHQSAAVILAHNHPGGTPCASKSDIELTKQLIRALDAIDITVEDHIIVAGAECYSFLEKKTLPYWY